MSREFLQVARKWKKTEFSLVVASLQPLPSSLQGDLIELSPKFRYRFNAMAFVECNRKPHLLAAAANC